MENFGFAWIREEIRVMTHNLAVQKNGKEMTGRKIGRSERRPKKSDKDLRSQILIKFNDASSGEEYFSSIVGCKDHGVGEK